MGRRAKSVVIPKYSEREQKRLDELNNHNIFKIIYSKFEIRRKIAAVSDILIKRPCNVKTLSASISSSPKLVKELLDYMILDELIDIEKGLYYITKKGSKVSLIKRKPIQND